MEKFYAYRKHSAAKVDTFGGVLQSFFALYWISRVCTCIAHYYKLIASCSGNIYAMLVRVIKRKHPQLIKTSSFSTNEITESVKTFVEKNRQ